MRPNDADRKNGSSGWGWRIAATAGLASLCVLSTVRGASGAFESQSIPVANLTEQNGLISGTVRMMGNRFLLYNGTRLESMSQSMEVRFERGGSMILCPRSQLQILTSNGNGGMMLAFQTGGAQQGFPLKMGDQVLTPDWRVELTSDTRTGDVGLVQVVTNRHGDLCLQGNSQPGSSFRVTPLFGDGSFQVAGSGQSARFSDGKMATSTAGCGCSAEFDAKASLAPVAPPASEAAEHYAAPAPPPTEIAVAAPPPAPGVPQSNAPTSTSVAVVQPRSQDPAPAAAQPRVKERNRPQDVAGYVRSFVHMIFGR